MDKAFDAYTRGIVCVMCKLGDEAVVSGAFVNQKLVGLSGGAVFTLRGVQESSQISKVG